MNVELRLQLRACVCFCERVCEFNCTGFLLNVIDATVLKIRLLLGLMRVSSFAWVHISKISCSENLRTVAYEIFPSSASKSKARPAPERSLSNPLRACFVCFSWSLTLSLNWCRIPAPVVALDFPPLNEIFDALSLLKRLKSSAMKTRAHIDKSAYHTIGSTGSVYFCCWASLSDCMDQQSAEIEYHIIMCLLFYSLKVKDDII